MGVFIRQAKEEDIAGILDIWNHEILNSTSIFEENPIDENYLKDWYTQRLSKGFPVLVAIENDQVIAYGSFGPFRAKSGYDITVEHSIYLQKDHRGKGIGKLLMRELLRIAKEMNLKNVIAVIDASNTKSIRFHERFGFIECGRLERIAIKFEKHLDAVIMQHQIAY